MARLGLGLGLAVDAKRRWRRSEAESLILSAKHSAAGV